MADAPDVSVIVPCYNRAELVKAAVRSVVELVRWYANDSPARPCRHRRTTNS